MFHAPPGQEKDTAVAGSIYGALAAGGARPVPVNLALPGPVDLRLVPVPARAGGWASGEASPLAEGAPAPAGKPRARSATRKQKAKPKPKAPAARTPTSTPKAKAKKQTTLVTITRKEEK